MDDIRILLAPKWVEAIFDDKCVSDRILLIKLVLEKSIVTFLSVYASQAGLDDNLKDLFYENLQWTLIKLVFLRSYFVCGHFSGHIRKNTDGQREFMVVADLEESIWRVREFLNFLLH